MRTLIRCALLAALLLPAGARPASAQIIETRQGDSNPMVSVFKSTIYGAGAGTLLGLAVAVADEDDDSDPVRWGFVAGTFFGFAYGIYHVSTRPEPHALLERGAEGWALAPPDVAPDAKGVRVRLLALRL
jgi:hypothetical protein